MTDDERMSWKEGEEGREKGRKDEQKIWTMVAIRASRKGCTLKDHGERASAAGFAKFVTQKLDVSVSWRRSQVR